MSEISNLYDHIENEFNQNKNLISQISTLLSNLESKVARAAEISTKGYCSKFTLPSTQVSSLFKLLNLEKSDVSGAFKKDWGYPKTAKMHSDPYYHVLLLLVYWGIKKDNHYMMRNGLLLILIKIWNGRKQKYLKFCNVTTMNYVIEKMLNKKHLAANEKYNSPYLLIVLHFIPTLLETYKDRILQDDTKLKRLFEQGWNRIDQLFLQKEKTYSSTKKIKPASGLLMLYMKAQEEGLTLSSPNAISEYEEESYSAFEDEDSSLLKQIVENIFAEISNYDDEFLKELHRETKAAPYLISKLLALLHSQENKVFIQKFCQMIIYRIGFQSMDEIMSPGFKESVEKKIISSKRQEDVKNIKDMCDSFIKMIYKGKKDFRALSMYKKHQRRKILILGLVYDIQERANSLDKKDLVSEYLSSRM